MAEPSDQFVANLVASTHDPDLDEPRLEDGAVAEATPTRSRLGLLDLPAELRVMIFRQLLVSSYD